MADNKVIFGLKNVHYSVITEDAETGGAIYGAPIPLKGATEISLDPKGKHLISMQMICCITQLAPMQDMNAH